MKHFAGQTRVALLVASISLLTSASTLRASTISILDPGDNRVTIYTDAGGVLLNIDVRGQAFLSVTSPGADVILVDSLGGANTSAFPNSELLGVSASFTEAMAIFLNFAGATLGPTDLVVPVLVAPLTAITDPSLAALTSLKSLHYVLAIGPVPQGNSILYQYDLAGATTAVPEPAYLSIGGLLVLAGLSRLRRRSDFQ